MSRQQRMIFRMIERTDKTEKLLREEIKRQADINQELRLEIDALQQLVKDLEQFEPANHYNNRNRIS